MNSPDPVRLAGGMSLYELARAVAGPDLVVLHHPKADYILIRHPRCPIRMEYRGERGYGSTNAYYVFQDGLGGFSRIDDTGPIVTVYGIPHAAPLIERLREALNTVVERATGRPPRNTNDFDPAMTALRRACGRMRAGGRAPARLGETMQLLDSGGIALRTVSPLHTLHLLQ